MKPLRVFVVDDSAFNRRTLTDLLAAMPGVTVVGKAADGDEALRLATTLKPDLITLDLEMPRMDGFTFLRLLMARQPTPVIVISGHSQKENVFRALELGAIDFIAKPTRTVASDLSQIQQDLADKVAMVRQLSPAGTDPARRGVALRRGATATGAFPLLPDPAVARPVEPKPADKLVVIGSSTGGPTALLEIFGRLPVSAPAAVVAAQHMPERFTRTFAERLDRLSQFRVTEGDDVDMLHAGRGVICPGGKCIEVARRGNDLVTRVIAPTSADRYVPSVDRLFATAAAVAGDKVIAVVLTGMGDDGSRGIEAVHAVGGTVLAEAPETAVVYGMPGAAMRTGCVSLSLPLRNLAEYIAAQIAPRGARGEGDDRH